MPSIQSRSDPPIFCSATRQLQLQQSDDKILDPINTREMTTQTASGKHRNRKHTYEVWKYIKTVQFSLNVAYCKWTKYRQRFSGMTKVGTLQFYMHGHDYWLALPQKVDFNQTDCCQTSFYCHLNSNKQISTSAFWNVLWKLCRHSTRSKSLKFLTWSTP